MSFPAQDFSKIPEPNIDTRLHRHDDEIPLELLDMIIKYLSKRHLLRLSCLSPASAPIFVRYLYRNIKVTGWIRITKLFKTLVAKPSAAQAVRELDLDTIQDDLDAAPNRIIPLRAYARLCQNAFRSIAPNLFSLSLTLQDSFLEPDLAIAFPNLQYFCAEIPESFTLLSFIQGLPKLRDLGLSGSFVKAPSSKISFRSLTSFVGCPETISAIVPHTNTKHVGFLLSEVSENPQEQCDMVLKRIASSTGPVNSLLLDFYMLLDGNKIFISNSLLKSTFKHLPLLECLAVDGLGDSSIVSIALGDAITAVVSKFENLTTIKFSLEDKPLYSNVELLITRSFVYVEQWAERRPSLDCCIFGNIAWHRMDKDNWMRSITV